MLDKEKLDDFLKKIEKEEKKDYKIFVEIGPGSLAIPTHERKKFEDHEIYIGIDRDYSYILGSKDLSRFLKKKLEALGEFKNKNLFFLHGSAEKLPFKDNFVDEIFLGNFVSYYKVSFKTLKKVLKEVERVLKEGGVMIVKENLSPNFEQFRKILEELNLNFELKKVYFRRDEEFEKEFSKYENIKNSIIALDSYIAYFVKKKNN